MTLHYFVLRQADSVERHPLVWSSRDGQVIPGQGCGHGGQQLHLLLCLLLRPHVQVAGREREVSLFVSYDHFIRQYNQGH